MDTVPVLRASSGSRGPHRPLHTCPQGLMHTARPTCTLRLLQTPTTTHKYKHIYRESQRGLWVHARTCTHEG